MCTINIYLIGWLYALQIIFSRNFFSYNEYLNFFKTFKNVLEHVRNLYQPYFKIFYL